MKNKISKILGVGLAISLLASLLTVATPASAGTLEFTTESLPSGITFVTTTASFVSYAVSADGNTIYGVAGTGVLYKSTNGGSTWVSRTLSAAVSGQDTLELVAIAPDNADVVAVANASGANATAVFISTNGAATGETDSWSAAGNLTAAGMVAPMKAMTISPSVNGIREIVVAGTKTGPLPGVFALNLGGTVATWTDITGASFTGAVLITAATTTVYAVAFSPNFVTDRTMTAVSNDSATGLTYMNLARFNTLTTTTGAWNAPAFPDYTGADINHGLISAPPQTVTALAGASISLASTYSSLDSASRIAFVSIDSGGVANVNGVYRLNDAVTKMISLNERYSSVAYNGTNLVAGHTLDNVVYRSTNPLATSPDLTLTAQSQRPSGSVGATVATNTMVAWAGTNVVAATQGNESAFARSGDNGATFNDVSFINTKISNILDIALSADASNWYMVTNDVVGGQGDISVWSRTGTTWERVMSILIAAQTAPGSYNLRIAPDNGKIIYLVAKGTPNFYYSDDAGIKNWATRIANENITDLAVESASVAYYTSGANVRKSTNSGFLWSDPSVVAFTTGTSANIKSLGKDKLILSNNAGTIAYSTDAAVTFTRLGPITGATTLQATATTLATGDFIFAADSIGVAADNVIWRYKVGSVAPDAVWKRITGTTTATLGFTGLTKKGNVLYATAFEPTTNTSTVYRSLNPAEAGETSVTFTALATAGDFTLVASRTSNLQMTSSTAGNTLWAIDADAVVSEEAGDSTTTVNDEVYSFTDTLALAGPVQAGPAANSVIQVNPVSGNTFNMVFSWARPSLATDYELQVAYDNAFSQPVIVPQVFGQITGTAGFDPATTPVAWSVGGANFNSGTTYFWRVRTRLPYSPWSNTMSFSTSSLDTPFAIGQPSVGATGVLAQPIFSWTAYKGAKWYELTLSQDPSFAIPEWSHNVYALFYGVTDAEALKAGTTYYWRVRGVTADPFVQGTTVVTPSGPYQAGAFTTAAAPVKQEPSVITIEKPAPPAPPAQIIQVPVEKIVQQSIPNWMLMTIIVIGAVLVIALIVLIVRTRRAV